MRRRLSISVGLAGLLGAAATAVVLAAPAQAIADGYPVTAGHYRFSVKLTMTNIPRPDGTHYNSACSGALIAQRWIITAGHCFHDVDRNRVSGPVPYPTMATIGRTIVSGTGGHDVSVVWVQQSPSTDIALGELASPVTDVTALALSTRTPKVGDRRTGRQSLFGAVAHMRWRAFRGLTIWSSAASVASPLQRRVRPRPD